MSWIDLVTEATKGSEAPERYFWWSAMAMLSATVKKNVWVDRYYYKLYPNIFVVLVSRRSGLRKGVPISLATRVLTEVNNTRIIEGRNTIESIIQELSTQRTTESIVHSEAQGILLSGEWDTFLVENDHGLTILTALHNTHEHTNGWKYSIKSAPEQQLKAPCITLLAASNETLFNDMVQAKDIEGGFIARTFIVYESKRRGRNSLMERPEGIVETKVLAQHLKDVAQVEGEFILPPRTRKLYDKWYNRLCDVSDSYDDRTGTLERTGDQVLKAAMLISLSKKLDKVIELEDLQEAIDQCEYCIAGVKKVTMGAGQSEIAPAVAKVLKLLIETDFHELSRLKLLQRLWPDIDAMVMDRVIETLTSSGAVITRRGHGKEGIIYTMPESVVSQYNGFKS